MSKCKYYLEKEVVSYDGGITWNETGVTRKGNLYEESSEDCTDPSVQYRWINMDISTDWICDGTNKYYKQKKQVSYDGIIWQDVTPAEYQRGSIYEVNSPDCQPTYRWVNLDISTDYICDGTTKYYKQKKQVSYGGQEWQDVIPYEYQRGDVYETQSTDCGYVPIIYRWVNLDISTDYICDGTTKYYKQKKQISFDGGQTWADVTPAEYQRGDIYETQSTDCGYVPPTVPKFQATYSGGQTYEKECDGNAILTMGNVKPEGYQASAMTDAVIGSCVSEIGRYSFWTCSGLTSVTIPNSVTSIGEFAFRDCSSLTGITVPTGVTSIGNNAFENCSGLTSVNIPSGVTSIGDSVFDDCSSLTSINIPSGVTSIGEFALAGCSSLTSIEIPTGVTSLGRSAFAGCSSLASVAIPNNVTTLNTDVFYACTGLTSVTIPNSVTSIGTWAFGQCYSLTDITIPNSVTNIGEGAFTYCSGLTSVNVPSSVTTIGKAAFRYCKSLTSVTIQNNVTSIGEYAFADCYSLTSFTCLALVPPSVSNKIFYDTNCPIYVPASSVEAYKSASGWSSYSSRIQAIP